MFFVCFLGGVGSSCWSSLSAFVGVSKELRVFLVCFEVFSFASVFFQRFCFQLILCS